jgi:SAM-dependent methyltransferase
VHDQTAPSAWIQRWRHLVPAGAKVLDVAAGQGRHALLFASQGCTVTAVDRDASALAGIASRSNVVTQHADLEGAAWPFAPATFDAIVVTNYLFRPGFPDLLRTLRPGGVLLYETFMLGNERFGRPSNPEFLLRSGELLQEFCPPLQLVGFEQGMLGHPKQAMVQRLCAVASSDGNNAPVMLEIA